MKKSVKYCQHQWLRKPVYVGTSNFQKNLHDSTSNFLKTLNQQEFRLRSPAAFRKICITSVIFIKAVKKIVNIQGTTQ
jgi:hypothetical protein